MFEVLDGRQRREDAGVPILPTVLGEFMEPAREMGIQTFRIWNQQS